jgi:hypothetical protein
VKISRNGLRLFKTILNEFINVVDTGDKSISKWNWLFFHLEGYKGLKIGSYYLWQYEIHHHVYAWFQVSYYDYNVWIFL